MNDLIEKFKEYNRKYFENKLKPYNVSTKEKIEAISKHSDYLIENIINSVIKRVIRDKVKELNNVEELNKVMPFENFETFEKYDKYANDAEELQFNELCDPNKNLNSTIYSPDAWYHVYLGNVIFLTVREIFRKERII